MSRQTFVLFTRHKKSRKVTSNQRKCDFNSTCNFVDFLEFREDKKMPDRVPVATHNETGKMMLCHVFRPCKLIMWSSWIIFFLVNLETQGNVLWLSL